MEIFDPPPFVKIFTSFLKIAILFVPLNLIEPLAEIPETAHCTNIDQARANIKNINFLVPQISFLLKIVLWNLFSSMLADMMVQMRRLTRIQFLFLYHSLALISFIAYMSSQAILFYYDTNLFWDLPIDCKEIMPKENSNSIFYFFVFKIMLFFFIMAISDFYPLKDGSFVAALVVVIVWKLDTALLGFPNENQRPNSPQEANESPERLINGIRERRVNNSQAARRCGARRRVQTRNQQRARRNGPPPAYEEIQQGAHTNVPEQSSQEHSPMEQEAPPAYEQVSQDGAPPPYEVADNNVMVIGIWYPRDNNQREEADRN
ncbi:hypothetical protein L3Y34_012368 [Caenorhabditis briggsae]|uniref:Uncharacterized protein n=1 Tax=Caenorhabditis briggsae TaxID=6238 RepID=A0AAE8ZYD1_CAEBR|nr:hypothetical protein L3Y34_012368 [Caenorhabditis briggsae]